LMTLQELPNGSVAQPLPAGAANKAAAACGASQEPLDSEVAAGTSTGCPKGCADTVSQPSQPLPVFDLAEFLAHPPGEPLPAALVQQCAELAACLERTGALLVRDPRVSPDANDAFLDLLEAYFSRPDEVKAADARPELAYQVRGVRCNAHRAPWRSGGSAVEGRHHTHGKISPNAPPILPCR
jgi:hypothetical protein